MLKHLGSSHPAIGLSAALKHDAYLGNDQAIRYDKVITNFGNGYDKWSGHFTAPRRGFYVFTCTLMATNTDGITVEIVKNGQHKLIINSEYTPWDSSSGSVVIAMNKRDKVWVRRHGHGRRIYRNFNSFSGYLISTET